MGCRCLLPDGAMDALIDQGVLPPRASRRRSMLGAFESIEKAITSGPISLNPSTVP